MQNEGRKLMEDVSVLSESEDIGMVQKNGILVNTMRDEFSPFWYALLVHMMFKNLGNLCDSFKSLKT
jgi:hypothetical protein